MNEQDYEQLTLFPAGSPASHSVLPGSSEARKMTVTSGRRCLELYRNSGPLGSLSRMCLGSSIWRSTRCYLTWKLSATPSRRLLFRLQASMPRTDANELPLWPTPAARDWRGSNSAESICKSLKREKNGFLGQLPNAVLWTTPCAADAKGSHGGGNRRSLRTDVGGQLNPTWVEWLMGFPIGWTDLNASETP